MVAACPSVLLHHAPEQKYYASYLFCQKSGNSCRARVLMIGVLALVISEDSSRVVNRPLAANVHYVEKVSVMR
jgi:hypothetical protein